MAKTASTPDRDPMASTRDAQAMKWALGVISVLFGVGGLTADEANKLSTDVSALHSHRMMRNACPADEIVEAANSFYCGGFGVTVRLDVQSYGFVDVFCRSMAISRDVSSDYASALERRGMTIEGFKA